MNSEQHVLGGHEQQQQSLVAVGDPSLTLAARKLAGSDECLNCGTRLKGPFCYYCGQPDRNFIRFFPVLLRDLMEDLLDLDSRFIRTMKPLLFKPGHLTRDYLTGKRFRYAPPMRLYIFSSIVFFLLAAFLSSDAVSIGSVENNDGIVYMSTDNAGQQSLERDTPVNPPRGESEPLDTNTAIAPTGSDDEEQSSAFNLEDIQFNEQPWDRETNPVDIRWLPDWLNDRINDEIEESPHKASQINENPNLIIDQVFDLLPATMFILLPLVALIFKFWYLFAKRYYIEHLIFSLHNHSFLFVSLVLILLANVASTLLGDSGHTSMASAVGWLITIISIWIPVYMLLSLRVVYAQSWSVTVGKFFAVGLSYLSLLSLVTIGVAIAGFVLL